MKSCDWTLERLDDYADGELDTAIEREVAEHLESCAACRDELGALRALLAQAARLPKYVEPPRDLWPQLEARLSAVRFPNWRKQLSTAAFAAGIAAMVVLAAGIGLSNFRYVEPQSIDSGLAASVYETDRAALREVYAARADALDDEWRGAVDINLGIIEQSMADIQLAMADFPGDRKLERMLRTAYRSEVELLSRAVRANTES